MLVTPALRTYESSTETALIKLHFMSSTHSASEVLLRYMVNNGEAASQQ